MSYPLRTFLSVTRSGCSNTHRSATAAALKTTFARNIKASTKKAIIDEHTTADQHRTTEEDGNKNEENNQNYSLGAIEIVIGSYSFSALVFVLVRAFLKLFRNTSNFKRVIHKLTVLIQVAGCLQGSFGVWCENEVAISFDLSPSVADQRLISEGGVEKDRIFIRHRAGSYLAQPLLAGDLGDVRARLAPKRVIASTI